MKYFHPGPHHPVHRGGPGPPPDSRASRGSRGVQVEVVPVPRPAPHRHAEVLQGGDWGGAGRGDPSADQGGVSGIRRDH